MASSAERDPTSPPALPPSPAPFSPQEKFPQQSLSISIPPKPISAYCHVSYYPLARKNILLPLNFSLPTLLLKTSPQRLHTTLWITQTPGAGRKRGLGPIQALHGGKSHAYMFSIRVGDDALTRATLTDPVGTGWLQRLRAAPGSAPLALAALHDQPDLFRHPCVVTVGLLHVCWGKPKQNTYSEVRVIFFLAIN